MREATWDKILREANSTMLRLVSWAGGEELEDSTEFGVTWDIQEGQRGTVDSGHQPHKSRSYLFWVFCCSSVLQGWDRVSKAVSAWLSKDRVGKTI